MRIVFGGTPEFASDHLAALLANDFNVVGVYTQPDRPAGRGKKLQASPVKQLAIEHNIPVFQPEKLRKNPEAQAELKELAPDIMVVVAYGLILPKSVLDIPSKGCINVHGSLLPKWRGAAPIQRSIWAGDATTGVTTMLMDVGLDTGDMLLKSEIPILDEDTSASLYEKLAEIGPQTLVETLHTFDEITPEAQIDEDATHAQKLSKEEAELDWSVSATQLERNIRAFNPWPGTFFRYKDKNIKVWQANVILDKSEALPGTVLLVDKKGITVATGEGQLVISQIQIPGKKPMTVDVILNGNRTWITEGTLLPIPSQENN